MEQFSMKEWKPELVYNNIQRIEQTLTELNEEKLPLINAKREIEAELTQLNVQLKEQYYSPEEFNIINSKRGRLVKQKTDIDIKLSELKQRSLKLHTEKESANIELKKKPNEAIKMAMYGLRDKYLSFAADTTRVSSMRAMSSKFVEEIQAILGLIP